MFKKPEEIEPYEIPKQVEKLVELVESTPTNEEEIPKIEPLEVMEEHTQDDEISTIIDEAIEEISSPIEKETKEDFKLSREDVYEIKNFLVHLKDISIEAKNNSYKSMIEILKETHYIKKSQSANNKTTYTLMFMAGVAFGMADTKWMPFAKVIYDFFITVFK